MAASDNDARALLNELGVGNFNATMIIPLMFMAPAQSDPDMTQVKLITRALQRQMQAMGATWIVASGYIDEPTGHCLEALLGSQWNGTVWFDIGKSLLRQKSRGKRFERTYSADGTVELSGLGLLPELPSIPGGYVTVGLGAFLLYRHLTKKGR